MPISISAPCRATYRDSNQSHGALLGHLLFMTMGGQVMAYDSRQDSPDSEGDLLWPNRATDDFSADASQVRSRACGPDRPHEPPSRLSHVFEPQADQWPRRQRRRQAGPRHAAGGRVSGFRRIEMRRSAERQPPVGRSDVPIGCELFGDDELVFAADVGNHVAYVVRLSDGQL